MCKQIVRFFSFCLSGDGNEIDVCEVTRDYFESVDGSITYERNTVFENGVAQICLTIEPLDYPYARDVSI